MFGFIMSSMDVDHVAIEESSTPAGEKAPPIRHTQKGDVTMDSVEPWNDLNASTYKLVTEAPEYAEDAAPLEKCILVPHHPSHEDVRRLEEGNEQIRRSSEAKNMVFDAIYEQVPDKIKRMVKYSVGLEKENSRLQFSKLSEAELKRLTTWLVEKEPFANIKESEFGKLILYACMFYAPVVYTLLV